MLSAEEESSFDNIYNSELVYVKDCYKLCGDAYCCNFTRHKKHFNFISQNEFQELPLLPNEYEYMKKKGWLEQFGDFDHKVVEYSLDHGMLKAESIVSRQPGCACEHRTRPTICRLYPLLPVFNLSGKLIDVDSTAIYDDLEEMEGLPRSCQLSALPFDQLKEFLTICSAIASMPVALYYISAFRLTKNHVAAGLKAEKQETGKNVFRLFEMGLIRDRLIDHPIVQRDLNALAQRFERHYGSEFKLA